MTDTEDCAAAIPERTRAIDFQTAPRPENSEHERTWEGAHRTDALDSCVETLFYKPFL